LDHAPSLPTRRERYARLPDLGERTGQTPPCATGSSCPGQRRSAALRGRRRKGSMYGILPGQRRQAPRLSLSVRPGLALFGEGWRGPPSQSPRFELSAPHCARGSRLTRSHFRSVARAPSAAPHSHPAVASPNRLMLF
jgi:hypothetical protein